MHIYRKKSIIFLMGYLLIFAAVLIISLVGLSTGGVMFEIGMNHLLQNWILVIFSLLAIIKVVADIASIEGHAEYESRLRRAA